MRWGELGRRWICLIFGGAVLMPYMMAGEVITALYGVGEAGSPLLAVQPLVFLAVLPLVFVTGLVLPVRALAAPPAQALLGADIAPMPRGQRRTWDERRRSATWFTAHLGIGGVASGMTLAVVPFTLWTLVVPFAGDRWRMFDRPIEPGWHLAWLPVAGLAALAALVAVAWHAGGLLARFAPALLGPSPTERLKAAEEQTRVLAERNRLAGDLHDSVGHALSVVTIQSAAAARILDRDPGAARQSLAAIEQAARQALEELDHVLGVLRADDTRTTQPQPDLTQLPGLLAGSGARVEADLGDLTHVPALVSREAYRIVQESLTNALKHGTGPVRLAAAVHDDHLDLEVSNPVGRRRAPGGGRGLRGMTERVHLLRGSVEAGPHEGGWQVRVSLPLRSTP